MLIQTNTFLVKWLRRLSQFKFFYNDWLDFDGMLNNTGRDHIVNLDTDFFKSLKFDTETLKQYRIDAATLCAETLGSKPAICFSGGADSQARYRQKSPHLASDYYGRHESMTRVVDL